jgi:ParB family chromosome partitioning protein
MTNHTIWNELGLVHFNAGALPQAINAYENAIESDKAFLPARLNLARAYTRNGDIQKAEQTYYNCFDLAIQNEEQADIWTHLGQLYAQTGRQDEAQAAYNKATSLQAPEELEKMEEMEEGEAEEQSVQEESETLLEMVPDTVISADALTKETPFARLKLEDIYINPRQPRMRIDIEDLVESIREHGVIQPILVSPNGEKGHYILVSGQRRLEAARQVGLETIPAIIRQVDDRERLELALTENLQRLSLSSIEEAEAYAELKKEFGLTPEEIARRMGKSSVAISSLLEQRSLPERIKRALDVDRISAGHARALLKLDDPAKQLNAFEQILQRDLSVRKTEALVRLLNLELQQEIEAIDEPDDLEEWLENDAEVITSATAAAFLPTDMTQELPEVRGVAIVAEIIAPLASSERETTPQLISADIQQNPEGLPELAQLVEEKSSVLQESETEKPQNVPLIEELRLKIIAGENVVMQNPGNEEAWLQLAENYKKTGERQKAINAYEKALSLAPDNSTYFDKLGHIYIETGQYAKATDCFEQALSLDDKNIYLHCALASSYRRQGLEDEARFHIDLAASEMAEESPYNRACFESIYGNTDLALELLEKAIEEDDSVTLEKIEKDPDFDFIRQDERFIDFLEKKAAGQRASSIKGT